MMLHNPFPDPVLAVLVVPAAVITLWWNLWYLPSQFINPGFPKRRLPRRRRREDQEPPFEELPWSRH